MEKDNEGYRFEYPYILSHRGRVAEMVAGHEETRRRDAVKILKALTAHAALVELAKRYRMEAIAQGAADVDVSDIDDVLKLAGEA